MHDDNFTKGMRGQFRGDFSRDTFDPLRHFSRVLMQQGRVQLDADWNEQVSIILHYMRMLASDIIGPHGVPRTPDGQVGNGFAISVSNGELQIAPGHYYIDGIVCENSDAISYFAQPDLPAEIAQAQLPAAGDYLLYLDVWERHVSYIEDDYMREKALAGPDTASRAKVIWQMKAIAIDPNADADLDFKANYDQFITKLANEIKPGNGRLRARAKREAPAPEPCLISPQAKYRGPENQLYRVEIHRPGRVTDRVPPTFKWSRENASVIFPISAINSEKITLENLGRDQRLTLTPNDWVELLDDEMIVAGEPGQLYKVESVDSDAMEVTLQAPPAFSFNLETHPHLRRWDQKNGGDSGVPVAEGNTGEDWIRLEDGIEIQFPTPDSEGTDPNGEIIPHLYRSGDYWLIPARTATGDVEWPGPINNPTPLPPQGVKHHYAPIWRVSIPQDGAEPNITGGDLRRKLTKGWN